MFVGHDSSAPGVQLLQHHRHAFRAQLHGILPELFPQLAQLFGRHRVKFRLAPQVAAHLTRQATQGKSLCKAFILQQSGLCCICRDCHGKACAPQLLVGAQGIQQTRQQQTALAAQAQVIARAPLQGDRHSQRSRHDGVVFIGHINVLHTGKAFQYHFCKIFGIMMLALPQSQHCRLIGRLHQTIHRSGCPLLSYFIVQPSVFRASCCTSCWISSMLRMASPLVQCTVSQPRCRAQNSAAARLRAR